MIFLNVFETKLCRKNHLAFFQSPTMKKSIISHTEKYLGNLKFPINLVLNQQN